jgi:hypothetical protein
VARRPKRACPSSSEVQCHTVRPAPVAPHLFVPLPAQTLHRDLRTEEVKRDALLTYLLTYSRSPRRLFGRQPKNRTPNVQTPRQA